MIAGLLPLLFALAGGLALSLLHISLRAFRVACGVLLFLQALTLTFSSPGLSSISEGEHREAEQPRCSRWPSLSSPAPGNLSAAVLVMGRTEEWTEASGVVGMILVCAY